MNGNIIIGHSYSTLVNRAYSHSTHVNSAWSHQTLVNEIGNIVTGHSYSTLVNGNIAIGIVTAHLCMGHIGIRLL